MRLAPGEVDYCAKPVCQTRARVQAAQDQVRQRREKVAQAAQLAKQRTKELVAIAAARIGAERPAQVPVGRAPYISPDPKPQDPQAIRNYLNALDTAIAEAFAPATDDAGPARDFAAAEAHLAPSPLALDAICIACQGNCCTQGAINNSFVDGGTIAYYLHRHPDATAEEVRHDYTSRLPALSIPHSCVFHTVTGCALPRVMRAEVCNRWQCGAREAFAEEIARKGDAQSIAIGLAEDHSAHPEAAAPYVRVVTVSDGAFTVHDDLTLPAIRPTRRR